MKTRILICLMVLSAVLRSLPLPAAPMSFTPDDFTLGTSVDDGTQVSVSYSDGIYRVEVSENPKMTNQTRGAHVKFSRDFLKGKTILLKAELRCFGIDSFEKANHVGGKILCYLQYFGAVNFRVTDPLLGTRGDWLPVELQIDFPESLDEFSIVFGIQQGWGVLEFRNPTWEIMEGIDEMLPQPPDGFQCEYSPGVLARPAYRGVMSPPSMKFCEKDIRDLAAMHVNLVRYQIVDGGLRDIKNLEEYEAWFKRALDHLDALEPVLRECGIKVILDMHWPPGGRYGNATLMATGEQESRRKGAAAARKAGNPERFIMQEEDDYFNAYLRIWRETAERYKGNDLFYAYDLVNEPYQNGEAKRHWWSLQYDVAKAIREIDPEVPLLMEGNYCTTPLNYVMAPLPLKNIIYTLHMYSPNDYTHQGVRDQLYVDTYPERAFDYRDRGYDRKKLLEILRPAIEFQEKYGAKMQVGEFSVIAWAPGAAQWLDDVISLFEEYHWDWTYHAFREWNGWDLEASGTPKDMRPDDNTDRMNIMKKYWMLNAK